MKKLLIISLLTTFLLTGCGMSNSNNTKQMAYFKDTGVVIKDSMDREYHIIKDPNDYLYFRTDVVYYSISPVLDKDGKYTKDINTIKEMYRIEK